MMWMETIHINLPDASLAQVELPQLPELLQLLNLHDLIIRRMEDFEFLQWAILKTIQVLQLVAGDVKEFKVGHSI